MKILIWRRRDRRCVGGRSHQSGADVTFLVRAVATRCCSATGW